MFLVSFTVIRGLCPMVSVKCVCVCEGGTVVGNPLADIAFTFVMSCIIRECVAVCADLKLVDIVCHNVVPTIVNPYVSDGEKIDAGTSYVDDCLFYNSCKDPARLVDKLCQSASVIIDGFHPHGLMVNFAAGKSEIVLKIRGQGSSALKSSLADSDHLVVPTISVGDVKIG